MLLISSALLISVFSNLSMPIERGSNACLYLGMRVREYLIIGLGLCLGLDIE